MKEESIIGVDFRKKLSRKHFLTFTQTQPECRVAMEACATEHHWARTLADLGHSVRVIAPKFVKPYVKNQQNGTADAEATVQAASGRPCALSSTSTAPCWTNSSE